MIYLTTSSRSCSLSRTRSTSHHRNSTMWTHQPGVTRVALASRPTTCRLQSRLPGIPVTVWSGTSVSHGRHPTHLRQWSPSSSFSIWQAMRRSPHAEYLRRQKFLRRWISRVEQASWVSKKRGHHVCLWTVRLRRFVTNFLYMHLINTLYNNNYKTLLCKLDIDKFSGYCQSFLYSSMTDMVWSITHDCENSY